MKIISFKKLENKPQVNTGEHSKNYFFFFSLTVYLPLSVFIDVNLWFQISFFFSVHSVSLFRDDLAINRHMPGPMNS